MNQKSVISAAILSSFIGLVACCGMRQHHLNESILQSNALNASQITEITYERVFGCEGECPLYKVIFRKDGTASYIGTDHTERKGKYHAKYTGYYFGQLSKLIEQNKYFSLQDTYPPEGKDEGYIITSVVNSNGRKMIVNHGSHGPIELWAIEMSIEGAMSQIEWEKDQ